MFLTVTTEDDNLYTVEIEDGAGVSGLKTVVEFHSGIPSREQQLWHHSRELQDGAQLATAGVSSNDLILLRKKQRPGQQGQLSGPQAAALMQNLRGNPLALAQLPQQLREGVERGDASVLPQILAMIQASQEARRQAEIDALNEDEFDPEAQARIAERIRQQNIEANVDAAMEHSPEVFGEVSMLYVKLHVNSIPLKAFVDSGAQRCVMSLPCAERCNIAHLIDKRFSGVSVGVGGTQANVGRVHSVSVQVGNQHVPMAVTVIEKLDIDFLFGLDMLRRHRCTIDLAQNRLDFGSLDNTSLEFLPEHEIPNRAGPNFAAGEAPASSAAQPSTAPLQAAGAAALARAAATPIAQTPVPAVASTPSAAPTPQQQPPAASGGGKSTEDAKVRELMGLGFSREECLEALRACDGHVERAAALLFGV